MPWAFERLALPFRTPIVTDYDDAAFHRYDLHASPLVRWTLARKIDRVMKASAMVAAGNDYLAARALATGSQKVELVPTVVDVAEYSYNPQPSIDGKLRVGWIGSPSTWQAYCKPHVRMIQDVAKQSNAVVRLVGTGESNIDAAETYPWSEADEVRLIQGMDIGIMPLPDDPWARGKCGYKLIQYMACGIPVIASPVGVNTKIVEHGVNGFLASNEGEWRSALTALLQNHALRRQMGRSGRAKVEREYSLQKWAPKVAQMLLAQRRPRAAK